MKSMNIKNHPTISNFDPLRIVNEERKTFGIRTFDFNKYHVHCTKKINSLRKYSGFKHVQKDKNFKKSVFKIDELSKDNLTVKHLMITLFEIERCWASYRELRDSAQVELRKRQNLDGRPDPSKKKNDPSVPRSSVSNLRHRSHLRLSKAIKHSKVLIQLVELIHKTGPSLNQVYAYDLHLRGVLDFELGRWKDGLDHLSVSCVILKALGGQRGQSPRERALFYDWIDDTAPLIRYCAYKSDITSIETEKFSLDRARQNSLGSKLLSSWSEIEESIKASENDQNENAVELKWRRKTIPIRNPELVDIVSGVLEATKRLSTVSSSRKVEDDDGEEEEGVSTGGKNKTSKRKERRRNFLESKNPGAHQRALRKAALNKALIAFAEAESSLEELIKSHNRNSEISHNQAELGTDNKFENLGLVYGIVQYKLLAIRIQRDLNLVRNLNLRLKRNETKVDRRVSFNFKGNNYNSKNYQKLDILIKRQEQQALSSKKNEGQNKQKIERYEVQEINNEKRKMTNVKIFLVKKYQSKIYLSLLKVYETLIYDLESMEKLKIFDSEGYTEEDEDEEDLQSRLKFLISFYKAHRFFIFSRSYYLVKKFKESYEIYLRSYSEYRKSLDLFLNRFSEEERSDSMIEEGEGYDELKFLRDIGKNDDGSGEEDVRGKEKRKDYDLNELERSLEGLKSEILRDWFKDHQNSTGPEGVKNLEGESLEEFAEKRLKELRIDEDEKKKKEKKEKKEKEGRGDGVDEGVFMDVVFNYLTEFDLDQFDPNLKSTSNQKKSKVETLEKRKSNLIKKTSRSDESDKKIDDDVEMDEDEGGKNDEGDDEKNKSSGFGGGLWRFFSRS